MAKSLRSKSRRRNVKAKREIYSAKAIAQLKKTLGLTREKRKLREEQINQDLTEMTAAIEAYNKKHNITNDVVMEENGKGSDEEAKESSSIKLNPGQHPVWKSQRKIKAMKKAKKVQKNKQKKNAKSKTKGGKNKK